jgi:hypothetical protein
LSGQLYHYIASKDDILYLMHRRSQEMWHQHLADAGFEEITDPVAKLEHGLCVSMRYLSSCGPGAGPESLRWAAMAVIPIWRISVATWPRPSTKPRSRS